MKSLLLFLSIIFSFLNLISQSHMEACYNFNQSAEDQSKNLNTSTIVNANPTTDRFGNINNAYDFNGTSYINLNNDFDLRERTISFWFNARSISNTHIIYDSDHPGISYGTTKIRVVRSGGNDYLRMSVSRSNSLIDVPINTSRWYHVIVTVDTNQVKYYLDGTLLRSDPFISSSPSANGSNTVLLGASRTNDRRFDGIIDDVIIFNTAIDSSKVQSLFNSPSCELCIESNQAINLYTNLVSCYPLDNNVTDFGINSSNGTAHNIIGSSNRIGGSNQAIRFNGFNAYADMNSDFDYRERTINLWFNAKSISGIAGVLYDSDHPNLLYGNTKLRVINNNGRDVLRMSVGSSNSLIEVPIDTGQWYMATITVKDSITSFYLDGCLIDRDRITLHSNSLNGSMTAIVGASRLIDRFFNGSIDDIKIYNRDLKPNEVKALYDSRSACSSITSSEIEATLSDGLLSVFPIPCKEVLNISGSNYIGNRTEYLIYNIHGSLIRSGEINQTIIDVRFLPKGMYIIQLKAKGLNKSLRFIKE